MAGGYIKLYRQILDNPVVCKDSDHFAVWVYLLLNATHDNIDMLFNGKRITLNPGQLITGRKSISGDLNIDENKVRRILKSFETDQQIDRQRSNKNSLVTIVKWSLYQGSDQQNDQQVTNKRPTSDQQVTTNKNVKNDKNVKNKEDSSRFTPPTLVEVVIYAKEKNQSEELAKRFYDYFTTGDWIDSKGKKVKNWKQKFITWISYNGGSQTKRVGRVEQLSDYSVKVQEPLTLEEELRIKQEFEDLKNQLEKIG